MYVKTLPPAPSADKPSEGGLPPGFRPYCSNRLFLMKLRVAAAMTIVLLAIQLVASPCGAGCHQSGHGHAVAGQSAEHSCHESSAAGDVQRVAPVPEPCGHDLELGESAVAPAPGSRGDRLALDPALPPGNATGQISSVSPIRTTVARAPDPSLIHRSPSTLRI
jgi:hypothetical protein